MATPTNIKTASYHQQRLKALVYCSEQPNPSSPRFKIYYGDKYIFKPAASFSLPLSLFLSTCLIISLSYTLNVSCLILPPSLLRHPSRLCFPSFSSSCIALLYFNLSPLSLRTILLSVISLLNEPNTFSPANVDASVMYRKWRDSKGKDREYIEIIRYHGTHNQHS